MIVKSLFAISVTTMVTSWLGFMRSVILYEVKMADLFGYCALAATLLLTGVMIVASCKSSK